LGKRRPHDVATEPFELVAVATVDLMFGEDVDTERFSDGLARCRSIVGVLRLCSAPSDQTQQWLPRPLARDSDASRRRLVAGEQSRLLDTEWVGFCRVAEGMLLVPGAQPSFLLERLMHPPCGASCDVRNLCRGWCAERVKLELTPLVLDVHAVQSEQMDMDVESEG
jgi:hypothetical protein